MLKTLMMSCKKATSLIAKKEELKLTIGEKINLTIHLSMCRFCKTFDKQSTYISKQTKYFIASDELSVEDKIRIQKSLEK